jgi:hypothetical protein
VGEDRDGERWMDLRTDYLGAVERRDVVGKFNQCPLL